MNLSSKMILDDSAMAVYDFFFSISIFLAGGLGNLSGVRRGEGGGDG